MVDKVKDVFVTSRPISWVNTAYPFAAAYYITNRHVNLTFIIGSLFFLVPYNLLMYGINDVFDYESDLKNPRKGGVEGAVLDRSRHRLVLLTSLLFALPFIVYLLVVSNLAAQFILAYSLFMVIAYSAPHLRFKERPFLDSFTSASHFVSPMVYALVLTGWNASYAGFVFAFFAWAMASHAFGAVQDIAADRNGGIGSIATVFGARATVRFSLILYSASAIILIFASGNSISARVAAIPLIFYIVSIVPFYNLRDQECEKAHEGWKRFLLLNYLSGFMITIILIFTIRSS